MKIILGPASTELGVKIAKIMNIPAISAFFKVFPDGESYLRLETETLHGEDIVIVQTTSPPQDQRLIQLMLMADTARDLEARSITAVIPYFAYARQDKRFLPGEALSIRTIVKLFEHCGIDRIISFNAHSPTTLETLTVPVEDLSAIPLLAEYFRASGLVENPVSLSLGKKGLIVAKEADSILKGGYDYISTKRDVHTGNVTIKDTCLSIKNRDAIVFDDIISTGGTMAKAVKLVKHEGARRVYAACVHPLLVGDSYRRIIDSGAEDIVGTDCVPSPVSKVSIAPVISKALARIGA